MFLALVLGIVHSCRSNVTLDMIKNLKNRFFQKFQILQFLTPILGYISKRKNVRGK